MLIPLVIAITGCGGLQMSSVMNSCSQLEPSNYYFYTQCIRNRYNEGGNSRGMPETNAFYVYLDLITEERRKNILSETEARFYTQKAYEKTIGEANAAKIAASNANWAAFNQSLSQSNADAMRYREEFNRQLMNNIGRQNSNQLNCNSFTTGGITNTQCR